MSKSRILVVEDEPKVAKILQDYLQNSGYQVTCIEQGDLVVPWCLKQEVDLILLDLMIPGADGMAVCRRIRKFSDVPVIIITAKVGETDRLLGLEAGADDYICKPFSPREVVARVNAVLRRAQGRRLSSLMEVGPIRIAPESFRAWVGNRELKLTPSEFKLLQVLMGAPRRVFSRNELIQKAQGYDFDGFDRTIDSHIKNLRKKLAGIVPDPLIVSVYGIGYRLNTHGEMPADD